jgi:hypothetical protein
MMKALFGKKLFLVTVNVCVGEESEALTACALRELSLRTVLII